MLLLKSVAKIYKLGALKNIAFCSIYEPVCLEVGWLVDYIECEKRKMNTNKETNYGKAKVFLERKIKVHILKQNGIWYNGLITEISEGKDFFFIDDIQEGKKLIFFVELAKDIQEYKEDKK